MRSRTSGLIRIAITTALYVALSLAIAPLTYGLIQIRFSEMLVLLCVFNRDYCYSMILGCLLVNAFSPLGWIDVVFGTLGTALSVVAIRFLPRDYLAFVPPTLGTVLVALEYTMVLYEPFWLSFGTIMAGEFIAVGIIGNIVFGLLSKRREFLSLVGADDRYYALKSEAKRRKKYAKNLRELRKQFRKKSN